MITGKNCLANGSEYFNNYVTNQQNKLDVLFNKKLVIGASN